MENQGETENLPKAPPAFSVRVRRVFFGANPRNTLFRVLIVGCLAIFLSRVCWMPIKVAGWSMAPTYRDGTVTFVNRLSYLNHPPERGDVVAVRTRRDQGLLLKRIIGKPGEIVS